MQSAYDQGPFKPLNWFGQLTGQPDYASKFQEFRAETDVTQAVHKELEDIRLQHEKDLKEIEKQNLSTNEDHRAKLAKEQSFINQQLEVLGKHGVAGSPESIQAYMDAQRPYAADIGLQTALAEKEGERAKTGTSNLRKLIFRARRN
jgi:hypothetical protein